MSNNDYLVFQFLYENGYLGGGGSFTGGTFVTGFTYNDANVLAILQNDQPPLYVTISVMTGLTVNGILSATTFYGDGSNLTGLVTSDYFVTGGTFDSNVNTLTLNRQNGSVSITGFTSGVNTDNFVTGGTFNTGTLTLDRQNGSVTITGFTSTDTFVTGFTYTNNTFTISQNQGQAPLSVTTKPSVSGILSNYYNFA